VLSALLRGSRTPANNKIDDAGLHITVACKDVVLKQGAELAAAI
jgi:hypothetical protein